MDQDYLAPTGLKTWVGILMSNGILVFVAVLVDSPADFSLQLGEAGAGLIGVYSVHEGK